MCKNEYLRKAYKVIRSCRTGDQLIVARKYIEFCHNIIDKKQDFYLSLLYKEWYKQKDQIITNI